MAGLAPLGPERVNLTRKPVQLHEDLRREHEIQGSSDRSFGLVFAGFFALMGGLRWLHAKPYWEYPLGAAALFGVVALAYPRLLAPANRLWLKLGLLLFKVVNPVVMFVLYGVAIVPIGLLLRVLGKDPLNLRFDAAAQSYWIPREPPGPSPESMKNQF